MVKIYNSFKKITPKMLDNVSFIYLQGDDDQFNLISDKYHFEKIRGEWYKLWDYPEKKERISIQNMMDYLEGQFEFYNMLSGYVVEVFFVDKRDNSTDTNRSFVITPNKADTMRAYNTAPRRRTARKTSGLRKYQNAYKKML